MNKQDFINKWNVVYKNKEQELEFASEMDTDLDLVISQLPASVILDEEIDKLRMVADLISRIYHYGNFKAETHNERKLEKLLNELGLYPTTENEILSRSILNHPPVMGEGEKEQQIFFTYDRRDGEVFCAFTDKEWAKRDADECGAGMGETRLIIGKRTPPHQANT